MVELKMPVIYQNQIIIGYGGNQEWFLDSWAKLAGCASVLASNMYAYYHQGTTYELTDFLNIMEKMFQEMTPGKMGYPYLYKFGRTFSRMMNNEGYTLKPVYQKISRNYNQAIQFVLKSLQEGDHVGMLILYHRAPELKDDNWHWICLSGYIEKANGYDIIFSDCGERRVIDSHILFDIHYKNVFKMLRMKRDPKKEGQSCE